MKIGFLHPGEMGISLAASALNSGHDVSWVSEGRSELTRDRARQHNLRELDSLQSLCDYCDLLISVCPPHAAANQARTVREAGFQGLYADVNAISPQTVKAIARDMEAAGIDFVDGGIIGLPAWQENATWLYLAGPRATDVAGGFAAGPLETQVLDGEVGSASALKMCFAANTKGTRALLGAVLALAEANGVRGALEGQWERDNPGSAERTRTSVRNVARKAWRFTGEMREIAATFREAGLPGDFHQGAEEIYARQAGFKNADAPPIEDILQALLNEKP